MNHLRFLSNRSQQPDVLQGHVVTQASSSTNQERPLTGYVQVSHIVAVTCVLIVFSGLLNVGTVLCLRKMLHRYNHLDDVRRSNAIKQILNNETARQIIDFHKEQLFHVGAIYPHRKDTFSWKTGASSARPKGEVITGWSLDDLKTSEDENTEHFHTKTNSNNGTVTINKDGIYLIFSRVVFSSPMGPANEESKLVFEHEVRRCQGPLCSPKAGDTHLLRSVSNKTCASREHADVDAPCYSSLIASTLWLTGGTRLYVTADNLTLLASSEDSAAFSVIRLGR